MGIFFDYLNERQSILNELEAVNPDKNDQDSDRNSTAVTDYTQDQDDNPNQGTDQTPDNPANAPEDYTLSDEGEDQTPEEADNNPPEEGTQAGGQPEADNGGYAQPNDAPVNQVNTDNGGAAPQDQQPQNQGAPQDNGGASDDYDDYGGEGEDNSADDYDSVDKSDDEIAQLEDEIFAKFNSSQIALMNRDLKKNFNDLFNTIEDLIDRINDIPKAIEHIKLIEFVSTKLADLRDMLSHYLYYTYDTKNYTENQISYKRFIIMANQIGDLIGKIPSIGKPKG